MTKKIIRKHGDPTAGQKAAATRKRNKLEAAAKKKPTNINSPIASDRSSNSDIEKPDVKITPYPRTGDNRTFLDVLDNVGSEDGRPVKTEPAKPAAPTPALPAELLTVADVAEWLTVPFLFWAQTNNLPGLALTEKEASSVAEPLTTILNRHGATKHWPPDAIDGLKLAARVSPILSDRFAAIKTEREKRKAAGNGEAERSAPIAPAGTAPVQGAQATKPKEV